MLGEDVQLIENRLGLQAQRIHEAESLGHGRVPVATAIGSEATLPAGSRVT